MKKIFTLISMFMLCLCGMAAETETTLLESYQMWAVGDNGRAGSSSELYLLMKNRNPIATWICTLVLPEGVTLKEVAPVVVDGIYPEGFNPQITQTVNSDGSITLTCSGAEDIAITGTVEGSTVAVVTVDVASTVAAGTYDVEVKDIQLLELGEEPVIHQWPSNVFSWTIEEATPVEQGTIFFDTNGGVPAEIDPITQDVGTEVVAPEDPTKEGYTFAGWDPELPTTMPEGENTYTAQWTINSYLLTFIIDGDTISSESVEYMAPIVAPEAPEKEGFTFAGWEQYPETMPASDVTVTGSYTANVYTVTVIGEGVTVDNEAPKYGESVTVTVALDPDYAVTVTVNGEPVELVDGAYVIESVTGDITVEVTREALVEFFTPTQQYTLFSCPQALDFTDSEVKAYIATSFNAAINYAVLEQVEKVPVGTGVLLVAAEGATYKIPYANFNEMPVYDNNLFVAAVEETTVYPSEDGGVFNYVLGEGNSFVPVASAEGVQLPAQSAYLKMTFVGEAPETFKFGFDAADGITGVQQNGSQNVIFDLQGRRVSNAVKGIYIVNGKKVLR